MPHGAVYCPRKHRFKSIHDSSQNWRYRSIPQGSTMTVHSSGRLDGRRRKAESNSLDNKVYFHWLHLLWVWNHAVCGMNYQKTSSEMDRGNPSWLKRREGESLLGHCELSRLPLFNFTWWSTMWMPQILPVRHPLALRFPDLVKSRPLRQPTFLMTILGDSRAF